LEHRRPRRLLDSLFDGKGKTKEKEQARQSRADKLNEEAAERKRKREEVEEKMEERWKKQEERASAREQREISLESKTDRTVDVRAIPDAQRHTHLPCPMCCPLARCPFEYSVHQCPVRVQCPPIPAACMRPVWESHPCLVRQG